MKNDPLEKAGVFPRIEEDSPESDPKSIPGVNTKAALWLLFALVVIQMGVLAASVSGVGIPIWVQVAPLVLGLACALFGFCARRPS